MAWSKNLDWPIYHKIPEDLCHLYLKRLHLDKKEPSKEYLDELVKANLYEIPFENLNTTLWNQPVRIEPEALKEKILRKHRGGYCFELNGLFYLLLCALGFDASMCLCRQLRHNENCPVPATHCAVLVCVDGKERFCDVGYGGPVPRGSLELKIDCVQTVENENFCFRKRHMDSNDHAFDKRDSGWLTLTRESSKNNNTETYLMDVAPIHCYLSDFYGQNLLRSMGDSAFEILQVSRMTPDGYVSLTDEKLQIKQKDKYTEQTIHPEELNTVLKQYFDICSNCAE